MFIQDRSSWKFPESLRPVNAPFRFENSVYYSWAQGHWEVIKDDNMQKKDMFTLFQKQQHRKIIFCFDL